MPDSKESLEVDVEAVCQLLNVVGKQLDDITVHPRRRDIMDIYFGRLLSLDQHLSPHVRSMVLDVNDLRSNNWVPKQEKVTDLFFIYYLFISFLHLLVCCRCVL